MIRYSAILSKMVKYKVLINVFQIHSTKYSHKFFMFVQNFWKVWNKYVTVLLTKLK